MMTHKDIAIGDMLLRIAKRQKTRTIGDTDIIVFEDPVEYCFHNVPSHHKLGTVMISGVSGAGKSFKLKME